MVRAVESTRSPRWRSSLAQEADAVGDRPEGEDRPRGRHEEQHVPLSEHRDDRREVLRVHRAIHSSTDAPRGAGDSLQRLEELHERGAIGGGEAEVRLGGREGGALVDVTQRRVEVGLRVVGMERGVAADLVAEAAE